MTQLPWNLTLALLSSLGKPSSCKVSPSLTYPSLGKLASGPGHPEGVDIVEAVVLGVFNRSLFNTFSHLSLSTSLFVHLRSSKASLGLSPH